MALGNPWGSRYTLHTDDGDSIILQGYDYSMQIATPGSTTGWQLVHVADDPAGDAEVLQVGGYRLPTAQSSTAGSPALSVPTVEYVPGNVGGRISLPKGFVLHGTRSGRAEFTTAQEYAATVGYVQRGTDGTTGWHITCGDNILAIHMAPDQYGWHARRASPFYLACEFAQPVDRRISDAQVNAFCWWVQNVALAMWPRIPMVFRTHAELEVAGETGARDGKTDCHPYGSPDADDLRARIMARLGI